MQTFHDKVVGADHFTQSNFLTFKGKTQSSTFSGGIVKITFMIFLMIYFATQMSSIFNKQQVNFTQSFQLSNEHFNITKDNFMVGILFYEESNVGVNMLPRITAGTFNQTYELQKCTRQHWQLFSEQNYNLLVSRFDFKTQHSQHFYCLPLNYTFQVRSLLQVEKDGNFGSLYYVDLPENHVGFNKTNIIVVYPDALISADKQTYYEPRWKSLDLRENKKVKASFLLSTFRIYENHIFPFTGDTVVQKGVLTNDVDSIYSYHDHQFHDIIFNNQTYMRNSFSLEIYNKKVKYVYSRKYKDILSVFGLVGGIFWGMIGLVGGLTMAFSFSDMVYKLTLGCELFRVPRKYKQKLKSYNLFTHIKHKIYRFFDCLSCCKSKYEEGSGDYFQKLYDETTQQLCIKRILTRLIYLEKAVYFRNTDYQNICLFLTKKMEIEEAKKLRLTKQKLIQSADQKGFNEIIDNRSKERDKFLETQQELKADQNQIYEKQIKEQQKMSEFQQDLRLLDNTDHVYYFNTNFKNQGKKIHNECRDSLSNRFSINSRTKEKSGKLDFDIEFIDQLQEKKKDNSIIDPKEHDYLAAIQALKKRVARHQSQVDYNSNIFASINNQVKSAHHKYFGENIKK